MQTGPEVEQLSLFGPDTCSGKTCRAHSQAMTGRTFEQCWRKQRAWQSQTCQSLDLRPGHGNTNMLLGCGMMLASTEVPRIAGAFGVDTSTRANVMGAVHTAQSVINTVRMVSSAPG